MHGPPYDPYTNAMINTDGYYLYLNINVHIMSVGDNQRHLIDDTKRCFGSLFGSLFRAGVRIGHCKHVTLCLSIQTCFAVEKSIIVLRTFVSVQVTVISVQLAILDAAEG